MGKKVIVLGGGMGGLSAAYELAGRGFEVEVYEKLDVLGGKARSFGVPGSGTDGRPDLPAEHGFRVFPGWYRHVSDTMSRISYTGPGSNPGTTVDDRLVEVPFLAYAMDGKPVFEFNSTIPNTLHEWVVALHALFTHKELGVPRDDALFFLRQMLCFVGSGEKRRLQLLENDSWWDYLEADQRSEAYRRICATGMTRSLVATRAEKSSTYTVGLILGQMLFTILDGGEPNRILDGPTSSVWIDPWIEQMRSELGVKFYTNTLVESFSLANGQISGVQADVDGQQQTLTGDYFVCALPVEVVRSLLTDDQLSTAGIAAIKDLEVAWMNGIMYYTNRDVSAVKGHVIYVDSPWAVTSVSQCQFWAPEYALSSFGDGSVRDILSAIISEWDVAGDQVFLQPAKAAPSRETIKDEAWAQMKAARTQAGSGALHDKDLVRSFLDPDISDVGSPQVIRNSEPLLTNTVGSLEKRPDATTQITNLFLAADFVRTHTNLATMESANEAGRRAANAVLDADGAPAGDRAGVWALSEPHWLQFWKDLDDKTFDASDPGEPPICHLIDPILNVLGLFHTVIEDKTGAPAAPTVLHAMQAGGTTSKSQH